MDKGGPVSCARLEGRHKCSNCYTRLSCTKQDVLFGSLNSLSAERHKVLQDVESRTPWATGLVFRWKCWTSKSNVPAAAQCSMLLVLWNDGNTLARGIRLQQNPETRTPFVAKEWQTKPAQRAKVHDQHLPVQARMLLIIWKNLLSN